MPPGNPFRLAASGTFFAWVRHPVPGKSGREVAKRLVEEAGILTLPGEVFGPGLAALPPPCLRQHQGAEHIRSGQAFPRVFAVSGEGMEILYQDDHLVAVNKPPGLLVHRSPVDRRLAAVELPCAVGRYPTSRYSLVAASPETGRRHQLRRHFKHLFHPLIGDTKYGEGRHNRFFREELGCARLLLHARELSFNHPVTGEPVALSAPLDAAYSAVLDRLGWRYAVPLRK